MTPTSEISPDVRALAESMKAVPVGQTITYGALSDAIGRDVQRSRYLIMRAMTVARRETGAIFSNVIRVGYQRLPAEDAHKLGAYSRARIRRAAARSAKAIGTALAMANDVPDEAKRKASAEISALGLIQHLARDTHLPQPNDDAQPLPVALAARQFLDRMGGKA